uniref:Uncharacterized protein n=1 Tax=Cacopsylla melanoneura TaxID=428564 RepID=A0A8D8XTR7_9HEMI
MGKSKEAIRLAAQQLLFRAHSFEKAVFLSDSKAAIQAIVNMGETPSNHIQETRQLIQQLKIMKKFITLQWIPESPYLIATESKKKKEGRPASGKKETSRLVTNFSRKST